MTMSGLAFDVTCALQPACAAPGGLSAAALQATAARLDESRAAITRLVGQAGGSFLDLDPAAAAQAELPIVAAWDQLGIRSVLVLGIGGSSLGTRAVYEAMRRRAASPRRLLFLESIDPEQTIELLDGLDLTTTGVVVVTKSGTTIETMSTFFIVRERLLAALGEGGYRARVVAITDPAEGALRRLASAESLMTLPVPPGVGGRYSVLTHVGTLPLRLAGIDVDALLSGAAEARDQFLEQPAASTPAGLFAAMQVALAANGCGDVVFMPYVPRLAALGDWFLQLWAESLGKKGADGVAIGPTPIGAVGPRDQHSLLQLFMDGPLQRNIVFLSVAEQIEEPRVPAAPAVCHELAHIGDRPLHETLQAELVGVEAALREAGRPTTRIVMERIDEHVLGALLMTLKVATVLAGALHHVDPFGQPGVELGKKFAHGVLGHEAYASYRERLEAWERTADRTVVRV